MAINRKPSLPSTNPPLSPLPPLPSMAAKTPATARAPSRAFKSPSPSPADIVSTRRLSRFFSSRPTPTPTPPPPPPPPSRVLARSALSIAIPPDIPRSRITPPPKSVHRSISYNSFPTPPVGTTPDPRRGSALQRAISFESTAHGLPCPKTSITALATPVTASESSYFPFANSDTIEEVLDEDSSSSDQSDDNSTEKTLASSERSSSVPDQSGVVVSVRVRPEARTPKGTASLGDWVVDGRAASVSYLGREGGDYVYDNVFTSDDTNNVVYASAAKQLVRRVMEGYHGTVFAYGMTGSGKTYSMQGTNSEPGIIPNAVADIFAFIRETPNREFLLRVSYLEIFNERIYDLLAADGQQSAMQQENIKLREDSKRGVYASPLKEEIVQTPAQLLRIISQGHSARRTSSTQFNSRSSRSHAVIQVVIESRERSSTGAQGPNNRLGLVTSSGFRVSTLNLIDLAGSERASESRERRTEGGHINKSLLTLGTIISRLADGKGKDTDQHLPYRDSKLTRLLQSALSGTSLISILCTVQLGSGSTSGVAPSHTLETLSSLKFAARARNNIISHARRTEEEPDSRALLAEIVELRKLVANQQSNSRRTKDDEIARERQIVAEQRHSEQMLEMQIARLALKERIEQLSSLMTSFRSQDARAGRSQKYSGYSHQRSLTSTIDACIQSLICPDPSAPIMEAVGSIGSIQCGPLSITSESATSPVSITDETESDQTIFMSNDDLRAMVADKDRYIASLEEELVDNTRHSGRKSSSWFVDDLHAALQEKDTEITELRERLIDKDRMLAALRVAVTRRHEMETTKAAPAAVSKFAQNRAITMKPLPIRVSQPASRAQSPVVCQSPTEPPQISSPNPERIDEMTRLLREMASSISVPASLDTAGESTFTMTSVPNALRITLPGPSGTSGHRSPTPRFMTPISPSRHLSGWESGVALKRASLAKNAGEMGAETRHSLLVQSKPTQIESATLGLATPPASPPRELAVLSQSHLVGAM